MFAAVSEEDRNWTDTTVLEVIIDETTVALTVALRHLVTCYFINIYNINLQQGICYSM